jgi:A/G-specific adenine glycosylase
MSSTNSSFKRTVRDHYRESGRHALPWRQTRDPYRVLVSEVMLQQTQVKRVLPFYAEFTKRFPTVRKLAQAPLSEVLRAWQGLGYNRRAKYLHEAAKAIAAQYDGAVPRRKEELMALPGIGPYTAAAVRAFAWNEPDIFIETNIRTAFIRHFFPRSEKVPDAKLTPLIEATLDRKHPREWYSALMDYGSYLKQTEGNAARRSAHRVRQKPFRGSDREIRGAIVKLLLAHPVREADLLHALPFPAARARDRIVALLGEGLIERLGKRLSLPR